MVDSKLTALSATTSSTGDDLLYIVDDPSGTPASYKITKDNFFKFTDGGVIYDANGNEILKILKTASAVNEVEFQNGSTGNPAVIRASGETNIGILLTGKGTGKIQIGDAADPTKKLTFELVGATTAKTMTFTSSHTDNRTITFPDATDTLVGKDTTDTLTNKTLTAPKFADLGYIADPSGNELVIFDQTSSAVNEVTIVNNSTGVMPIIKASGETNIGLQLSPKGSGKVTITDGTDLTKKVDLNVSGVTTGTTRVLTVPDSSITLGPTVLGTQDIFIPATAMWARTTTGAGGLTRVETGTNKINYQVWEFDTSTQEYVQFGWIPPRNYNNGTVKFIFHWTNASGGSTETVDWSVAGVAISNDDALDVAMGTAVITTDTWIAQNDNHVSPQSTAVTIAGTPADSDFIMFEISRKTSTDNLTGDARLIGVNLEYTIDAAVTS